MENSEPSEGERARGRLGGGKGGTLEGREGKGLPTAKTLCVGSTDSDGPTPYVSTGGDHHKSGL